jgi:hypothetical protein
VLKSSKVFYRFLCVILILQLALPGWLDYSAKAYAQSGNLSWNIRFQTPDTTAPEGWLVDSGEVYGVRSSHEYGWRSDITGQTVSQATYVAGVSDTFIRAFSGDEWEIKLENGSYQVSVTVGEAVYAGSSTVYAAVYAESVPLEIGLLQAGEYPILEQSVVVEDGRLTLSFGTEAGTATALRSISIAPAAEPMAKKSSVPQIIPPPEARKITGNKVLLSGQSTNQYGTPEFIRVPGLDAAIGSYMDGQLQAIEAGIASYTAQAVTSSTSDPAGILAKIQQSSSQPAIIRAGQLNLDSSATFGSPDQPVILIVDGINTNQKLTLTVYGALIINQGLNANTQLTIEVLRSDHGLQDEGNLWVMGSLHLNQDSSVSAEQLVAGHLVYNSGTLQVHAKQVLVKGNMNINTRVNMQVAEEMAVGELISNNETADLHVVNGDFFVRGNVAVNNHLGISTGGWFAMGGNLVANKQPIIRTGEGTSGQTLLKYTINGLKAEYYSSSNFAGNKLVKVDEKVRTEARPILPAAGFNDQDFSVKWTGQLQPVYTEEYTLELQARGPVRLWVDGQLAIDEWYDSYQGTATASFMAQAGQRANIRVEYSSKDGNPQAVLYWRSARQDREIIAQEYLYPFGIPEPVVIPTETDLTLVWEPAYEAQGYEVEVDGVIHPISADPTYVYSNLAPGTAHTYRIRANSGDIIGEWSLLAVHWTLPAIPENPSLAADSDSITLSWDSVVGATGYEIDTNNTILDVSDALSYTDEGLGANMQRTYRVRAYNSSGPGQWSGLQVGVTLPGAPANLKTSTTDEVVTVSWDPVSGASSYDLRADGIVMEGIRTTKYIHAPVAPSSAHTYQVRASNGQGHSPWSSFVTAYAKPSVPTQVQSEATETSILVSWEPAAGAAAYEIEIDGSIIPVGTATRHQVNQLVSSSEHSYRVRAVSLNETGEWTPLQRIMTWPGIPAEVQATNVDSSTIDLTWEAVVGAQGYELDVDGILVAGDLNTSYRHNGLLPNSTHTYRVRAWNAGGAGQWSALASKTTGLGQPQSISVLASEQTISLTWEPVEGAASYEVLADGGLVDNGASTQYLHQGLEPYSRHLYRVRARSGEAFGDWSETVSTLTALGTPRITNIRSSSHQIDLEWTEVVGAAGYEVEADGSIHAVGDMTTFSHTDLPSNTAHTYRVRAVNGDVTGEWSNWSSLATRTTAPPMPANLQASATSASIALTWDRVMGTTGYEVEVDGQIIPGITEPSYVHGGLDPNTMHTYRVRSRGTGGVSQWTELIRKTTVPELTIDIPQDTQFNFVVVVPRKAGKTERRITVTYNPDELEMLDLSSITPEYERSAGPIKGTNMVVTSYTPGNIVYTIYDADKTVVNSIRLQTKSNEYSKVTYVIE